MQKHFSLENKRAIVTGAAKGLGKNIATYFAELGADLSLIDIDRPVLEGTCVELRKLGRKVVPIVADVSKMEDIKRIVNDTLNSLGGLDILVNNAGIIADASPTELTEEDWDKTMKVNLKAVFFLTREVAKHMITERYGKIISLASQAATAGMEDAPAYCASKGGIIGLTKSLATSWGQYNINVNALAPGVMYPTDMAIKMWSGEEGKRYKERVPLGRFGKPEEVAAAAAFLASDESNFITGFVLVLDGGWSGIRYIK